LEATLPQGVDHIVEVSFGANIDADVELLKQGGSIASYATDNPTPKIPFWQMVLRNIRGFFWAVTISERSKDAGSAQSGMRR
jgi:NADPH:quinone reductase-like Zn-dependent oxidoreductase